MEPLQVHGKESNLNQVLSHGKTSSQRAEKASSGGVSSFSFAN